MATPGDRKEEDHLQWAGPWAPLTAAPVTAPARLKKHLLERFVTNWRSRRGIRRLRKVRVANRGQALIGIRRGSTSWNFLVLLNPVAKSGLGNTIQL